MASENVALDVRRKKRWFDRIALLSFPVCLAVIGVAIWFWGAREVRRHIEIVGAITGIAFLWLVIMTMLFNWLGISAVDDAVERRNKAALLAFLGAILATALIYAAGNLGEGPSYSENVFSILLGTAGFFALWIILEIGGAVSMSIAEERDVASGVRFGGFALAIGLIIARTIAGDWNSVAGTMHDFFRDGWPSVMLCVGAIFVERSCHPTAQRPVGHVGLAVLIAVTYLVIACAWVMHLGRWEGMPK